jgi:nitroimidazol reductase NimA-like FMN-containing flavoprotein (pyridoxamine 5'-phosphate oxidase superfamily)
MNPPGQANLPNDALPEVERQPELSDLSEQIGRLVLERPYGVLCTQGHSQPYGSLVALGATDDLTAFVFATPTATRKYRLLSECDHVALVIDSRSGTPGELMDVEAVTVTGRARQVPPGPEFDRWAELLVRRHPHLASFVRAESSALFRIDVIRYFHVCRFQEVRQWVPSRTT